LSPSSWFFSEQLNKEGLWLICVFKRALKKRAIGSILKREVFLMKIVDKIVMFHLVVRDMDKAKTLCTDVLGFEATQDSTWVGKTAEFSSFPLAATRT
jgi:hypothetical protein